MAAQPDVVAAADNVFPLQPDVRFSENNVRLARDNVRLDEKDVSFVKTDVCFVKTDILFAGKDMLPERQDPDSLRIMPNSEEFDGFKWIYRVIYRVDDHQVGQWSNPVSVVVPG